MAYCWECETEAEFVRRLVTGFLTKGYVFYVAGDVPPPKEPRAVAEKLATRYGLRVSRQERVRRKRSGLANLGFLRFGRFFVLLATHGEHAFFEAERERIRDFRRQPLLFAGYSVSLRRDGSAKVEGGVPRLRGSVRIAPAEYRVLKHELLGRALEGVRELGGRLARVPFEPYAPVRRQLLNLLRAVNRARGKAGMEAVPVGTLRLSRGRRKLPQVKQAPSRRTARQGPTRPRQGQGF